MSSRSPEHRARLAAIETAYSDAQHDLRSVLTRPSLFDPADPVTAGFHQRWEAARRCVTDTDQLWITEQALSDLESAWQHAWREAERVGVSRFHRLQRLRLRRARRLLERARSDRGPTQLRSGYYFTALRLLDGLLQLPEDLRRELRQAALAQYEPSGPSGPGLPGREHVGPLMRATRSDPVVSAARIRRSWPLARRPGRALDDRSSPLAG